MMYRFIIIVAYLLTAGSAYALYPHFNWARNMGGVSDDEALSVAADASGNTYTTGYFTGTVDFDAGAGAFLLTALGYNDIFISKTDADGNFLWAKAVKGSADEWGESIALDKAGNIYITGFFSDAVDFDPGHSSFPLTANGDGDIFVLKLDADGNFVWAKKMGGRSDDNGSTITVDLQGNVLISGYYSGIADFNPGAPDTKDTAKGGNDIFIAKLDQKGNYLWSKCLGGTTNDHCNSIAADRFGNIYATGNFAGTADFDPGKPKYTLTSDTNSVDIFILKLDAKGAFKFAERIGGHSVDNASALAIDTSGNIYITGFFSGTVDFDAHLSYHYLESNGDFDIFITRIDSSGSLVWAKNIGGDIYNFTHGLALDAKGNIYLTGAYSGVVDFDPGKKTFTLEATGMIDMFIVALNASGELIWVQGTEGANITRGLSIAVDSANNIYTAGAFSETTDFNPDQGTCYLTSAGDYDIFIHKTGQNKSGIQSIPGVVGFSIYPNPCTDVLNVRSAAGFGDCYLEIYNLQNLMVYTQNALTDHPIDLSGFAGGLYIVKLMRNGEVISTRKLIKL